MEFGFFLMPCRSPRVNPTLGYEEDLRLVERAEDFGFEEFWVGEHHSAGWESIPSPEIFISAAAQRTKRIRLGTGVIGLPYHHPFLVAERMAFLDHLTHGRLMMGVGPGALPSDVLMMDIPAEEARPMMDESLDIIMRLYQEEGPVTYEGKYWQLRNVVLQIRPYQKPHMPLAVASIGTPHSLELAARYRMRVISAAIPPAHAPDGLSDQWGFLEQRSETPLDRADWAVQVYLYVADSDEQAVEDIRERAEREQEQYWYHVGITAGLEGYEGKEGDRVDLDRVIDARGWIVGDPDHCVERVMELQRASGGFGKLILTVVDFTSPEKWNHSLDLFARYVMPELQRSNAGLTKSWERMVVDAKAGRLPSPRGPVQEPLKP